VRIITLHADENNKRNKGEKPRKIRRRMIKRSQQKCIGCIYYYCYGCCPSKKK